MIGAPALSRTEPPQLPGLGHGMRQDASRTSSCRRPSHRLSNKCRDERRLHPPCQPYPPHPPSCFIGFPQGGPTVIEPTIDPSAAPWLTPDITLLASPPLVENSYTFAELRALRAPFISLLRIAVLIIRHQPERCPRGQDRHDFRARYGRPPRKLGTGGNDWAFLPLLEFPNDVHIHPRLRATDRAFWVCLSRL